TVEGDVGHGGERYRRHTGARAVLHAGLMKDYRAQLVITVAEAAEWLRTSEEAVTKLADDGRIPAVRYTPEDPPVFRPEDIVAFVERQSGSEQPSGLFSQVRAFAPLPPRPPVPPVPPTPPRAGFAFAHAPDHPGFEHSYEYSFTTDDTAAAASDAMRAQADAMRAQHDALAVEVETIREQLKWLRQQRDEQDR
ncbi:MAG TPA: helix-turn-helix domain-containing protein, partial [Acidimicrobiales bacterium]|nr:helix-turn-helix domain-containing protein [Acidimicrobiales bacterium]